MKSIVIALICCAGFTWSTAQAAAPKLNVGSMHDYIDSDKGTLLKRVRNSGDATAFVRVEISEIVYGADNKPTEQVIENTRLGNDKDGLVASPARMIIPAKSQQAAWCIPGIVPVNVITAFATCRQCLKRVMTLPCLLRSAASMKKN